MRTLSFAIIGLAAMTAACAGNAPPATTAPQPAPANPPAVATTSAVATTPAPAQPATAPTAVADVSGGWTGQLDAGGQMIPFEVTLTRGPDGYTGEINAAGQGAAPLSALTIEGDRVTMTFRAPQGDAVVSGVIASDRRTIAGNVAYQGQALPFSLTRK